MSERARGGAFFPFLLFGHYISASHAYIHTYTHTYKYFRRAQRSHAPLIPTSSFSGRAYACHDIPVIPLAALGRVSVRLFEFDRTAAIRADSKIRSTDVCSLVALPPEMCDRENFQWTRARSVNPSWHGSIWMISFNMEPRFEFSLKRKHRNLWSAERKRENKHLNKLGHIHSTRFRFNAILLNAIFRTT